jgi:hypothetical protein
LEQRKNERILQDFNLIKNSYFFSSTIIQIGDGSKTPFCEAKWIHGIAPKHLAPNLYKATRFKRRTVAKEMQNDNWIKNLGQINNSYLLNEYIMLYMALSSISLTQEQDEIS